MPFVHTDHQTVVADAGAGFQFVKTVDKGCLAFL